MSSLPLVFVMLTAGGCDLRVITLEEAEELVVAEVILDSESPTQYAWLHRTGGGSDRSLPGARVMVRSTRDEFEFAERPTGCVQGAARGQGTCYVLSVADAGRSIMAGERYELEIILPDGRRLTGTTTVPDQFQVVRPARLECSIEPNTNLELMWQVSATAWIYAAETELIGIRPPLEAMGIEVSRDPLPLFGLSAARNDTTIVFPKEFGLFNRFDPELTEALIVLQQGLPPGVVGETRIAAADRNYVNWVRGGDFNPSGPVRVPSVFGDGTGVFGSLFSRLIRIHSGDSRYPAC